MKIVIETGDETVAEAIASLKVLGDSNLVPETLEDNTNWLDGVTITVDTPAREVVLFTWRQNPNL